MSEVTVLVSSSNPEAKNTLTAIKTNGSLITFRDVMTSGKAMGEARNYLESPSYLTYDMQLGNEQVKVVGVAISNSDVIDIKQSLAVMYHARLSSNEQIYNQIMEMYNSVGLTPEDVQTLLNHYGDYVTGTKEHSIRLYNATLGFNEGTMFIEEFNKTSTAPEIVEVLVGHKEAIQESPYDLLDFPIPSYDRVKKSLEEIDSDEELTLEDQFNKIVTSEVKYPDFSKVNDPYMGRPGLRYIGWAEMINLYYKGFNPKYLTGFSENNDTPILEHEQPIYQALTGLVDEAIEDSVRNGIEIKEGGLPKPLYEYFEALVDLTLLHNRVHTGAASIIDYDLGNDEEDNNTGEGRGKSVPGSGVSFSFEGQMKSHYISISDNDVSLNNRNATLRRGLINFILEANDKYAFPEAIVKLLRWGELRPRLLFLENSETTEFKYFDLEKFTKREGDTDFTKLVPYVEDGADKFVTGIIMLSKDTPSSLVRDLMSTPLAEVYSTFTPIDTIIGVELLRTFENSKEEIRTYVDLDTLTDMVKRQRDGSKIHGIEYVNGQFHIEDHVYDAIGIDVNYVDGKRVLKPDTPQTVNLQSALTNTINDSDHFRLQPSLKVLNMLRNAGLKVDETLTAQTSLLNLWNIFTSMVNYTEIEAYDQVVVYDNDSDAETNSQENIMRLKTLAVEQNIGQQNAILRKAIQEYGDLIFKLNEMTYEFTDYKYIGIYEVAIEKYLNGLCDEVDSTQTTKVQSTPVLTDAMKAKERLASAVTKQKAYAYVIQGKAIGYRVEGNPIKIIHPSTFEADNYTIEGHLTWNDFRAMFAHFANKNMAEVNKYDKGVVPVLNAIASDVKRMASGK